MDIETALATILGDKLAHDIIADQSIQWAVVAAMSHSTLDDDPEAIQTIRDWLAEQRAA